MNPWNDIESAPKDRRIIIATDTEMYMAHWVQNPFTGDEAWLMAVFDADAENDNQVLIKHGLAKAWAEAPEHPFNQQTINECKQ